MNLLQYKHVRRGCQVVAPVLGAITILILLGSLLHSPVQAKAMHVHQEVPSVAADLTIRLQVTDTTDLTDTTGVTDTTVATEMTAATDTTSVTDTMTGGDSPENAWVPPSEETTLAPGERRWYIFQYSYDGEGDASNAIVELRMAQPGSISFEVWSQDDVNRWRNGEDFTPTGAGTPAFAIEEGDNADNRDRSLLRWVGNAEASVRFYVVVRNHSDAPASFRLTVSGPDVSFLTPESAASGESSVTDMTSATTMTDTTTTDTSTVASGTDMTVRGGTGPEDAVSPIGQRETLAAGERRWYVFQYSYDGEGDASNVIAELRLAQPGSVSFEVWSQDDVNRWRNGEDFTPTGAGTPAFAIEKGDNADDRDPMLLRWVGNAEASVRFYLILRNTTDTTAAYRLTVSGPDVSFLAPALGDTTAMTDTAGMTETTDMTDMTAMTDTATAMSGGSGPEDALPITGQRTTLGPNERRWYTFEYAFDGNGDPSNAIVELRMAQPGSLGFEVWSGENVQSWQNNEEFSPTGAGTPAFAIAEDDNADDRDRSLLRWVGNADTIARFYVIVENNTDAFVSYRLTASGPDVRN